MTTLRLPADRFGSGRSTWAGAVVCALLLVTAMIRETGMVGPAFANAVSLLWILAGVAVAVRGSAKLPRLAELYLWLAFILTLSLLQILAQNLARWTGMEVVDVFRLISIPHVITVVAALGVLGAWSRKSSRLAAGILILGAVVFWTGARTFPGTSLEEVAASPEGHLWTSANFLLATLITIAGLGFFTVALREAGDRFAAVAGLFTYSLGAVFWILHLAFRLTVMREVAEEYGRSASTPLWYPPWNEWAGLLFGIYSVLAYLGIVAYGVALLRTGLLARWVGWTCVAVGLLAAPLVGPPFFIHAVLWFVGILMLRRSAG